jgi:hypothetical protein
VRRRPHRAGDAPSFQVLERSVDVGLPARAEHERGALEAEALGDGEADARRGGGNEGYFPLEAAATA